jgi:hypothetical protein
MRVLHEFVETIPGRAPFDDLKPRMFAGIISTAQQSFGLLALPSTRIVLRSSRPIVRGDEGIYLFPGL